MASYAATGTASVEQGATTVYTTADFRANLIEEGAEFQIPGEFEYQITATDPQSVTPNFTIDRAYAGADKTDVAFWIKPYPGAARAAQAAMRDLTERMQLVLAPSATDTTAGRIARIGDHGENGYPIILTSADNLRDVIIPGNYAWFTGDEPSDRPAGTSGAHRMRVEGGAGQAVTQHIYRHTFGSASRRTYWRNVFPANDPPADASEWSEIFDQFNVLRAVSLSGGFPSGGLSEIDSGSYDLGGDASLPVNWWVHRDFAGWQTMHMEVPVDVTSTGSQLFDYPDGYDFVAGGTTFAAVSHAATSPHSALQLDNIRAVASYNTMVALRLVTGGTSTDVTASAERMRLAVSGRWANA